MGRALFQRDFLLLGASDKNLRGVTVVFSGRLRNGNDTELFSNKNRFCLQYGSITTVDAITVPRPALHIDGYDQAIR